MILRPLESASDFELTAAWLQLKENSQWLDFGGNRQAVTPALLKIMVQRQTNFIRVYTSYEDDAPLGIVALNNVDRNMRTGTLWGVAGDKSFRCRGCTQVAASHLLTVAFQELGLHSVNTWTVEHNASRPSGSAFASSAGSGSAISSTGSPTIGCCSICSRASTVSSTRRALPRFEHEPTLPARQPTLRRTRRRELRFRPAAPWDGRINFNFSQR